MRLEKSFGTWYREYRPIYTPLEAGMERVMKFDHDFIGRAAVEAEMAAGGPSRKLVMFDVEVDPEAPADVIGDEPVWHDGEVVGWITSGGYAHYSARSLALGYIPANLVGSTGTFEIEIIGRRRPARILHEPVLDPQGQRMRA
jgi:dimethylglycine dehydrogenase